jgi:hypothetical protein
LAVSPSLSLSLSLSLTFIFSCGISLSLSLSLSLMVILSSGISLSLSVSPSSQRLQHWYSLSFRIYLFLWCLDALTEWVLMCLSVDSQLYRVFLTENGVVVLWCFLFVFCWVLRFRVELCLIFLDVSQFWLEKTD